MHSSFFLLLFCEASSLWSDMRGSYSSAGLWDSVTRSLKSNLIRFTLSVCPLFHHWVLLIFITVMWDSFKYADFVLKLFISELFGRSKMSIQSPLQGERLLRKRWRESNQGRLNTGRQTNSRSDTGTKLKCVCVCVCPVWFKQIWQILSGGAHVYNNNVPNVEEIYHHYYSKLYKWLSGFKSGL